MPEPVEITGGAGEFEAAAVIAVIGHVLETEEAARSRPPVTNRPPAWMRAVMPRNPDDPLENVRPE